MVVTSGRSATLADMEPTQRYGLSASTRKPVRIACSELARSINALDKHHAIEREATDRAFGAVRMAAPGIEDEQVRGYVMARATKVVLAARHLRNARGQLLGTLDILRPILVDALIEGHGSAAGYILTADVDPGEPVEPPHAAGGALLDALGYLKLLGATADWTAAESFGAAASGLGPAYLLSFVIEAPLPDASALRKAAREAWDGTHGFISRASSFRATWELEL